MPHRLTPEQEQRLVLHAQHAPDGVRALYQQYVSSVYTYMASQVGHPQDAEDLTSETFLKAIAHLDTFRWQGGQSLSAWLFRIAHNTVQDFRRHHARHHAPLPLDAIAAMYSPMQQPDELIVEHETFAYLHHLIQTLPPRRREVVLLKFFGGLRNQEIALILALDERTVAAHLSRALRDLYRKYRSETGEEYAYVEHTA